MVKGRLLRQPNPIDFMEKGDSGILIFIRYIGCMASNDPILSEIRSRLENIYGDRLKRVVLFGSRARGEAQPDSDYDVAVFLRDMKDRWEEFDRLVSFETAILYERGAVVEALPFAEGKHGDATPLMGEIRRDGVDL